MAKAIYPYRLVFLVVVLGVLLASGVLAGCNSVAPVMSYQGRLTDAAGKPLDGTYQFQFRLFDALTGGTELYTETESITVTNGLFDTSIGPSTIVADLRPEMLSQPLWLEVTINGEVLSPRQQLLGAPYAFTLMPGAVISAEFPTSVVGTNTNAVLTVANSDESSDPLPSLRVEGLGGLEIVGVGISDGVVNAGKITSLQSSTHSDLLISTNDEIYFDLDDDNNSASTMRIRNGGNEEVCTINEAGNLICTGTKSAVVLVEEQMRKMYALESPEVWFEDFGSGALVNGAARVEIDPLFAAAVNLASYHIFVTPLGDCQGLYVADKTPTGFEVRELGGGTANIAFDYRLVAKRLGYETERMELYETEAEEGE